MTFPSPCNFHRTDTPIRHAVTSWLFWIALISSIAIAINVEAAPPQDSTGEKMPITLVDILRWDGYSESMDDRVILNAVITELERLADAGDAQAQFVLARLLYRGKHIREDKDQAATGSGTHICVSD